MRLLTYNVTLLVLLAAGSLAMRITHVISADAFWICACIEALIGVTMSNGERGRKEEASQRRPFDPFTSPKTPAGKAFIESTEPSASPLLKRAFQICMLPVAIAVFLLLLAGSLPAYVVTGRSYLNRILDLTNRLTLNFLTNINLNPNPHA